MAGAAQQNAFTPSVTSVSGSVRHWRGATPYTHSCLCKLERSGIGRIEPHPISDPGRSRRLHAVARAASPPAGLKDSRSDVATLFHADRGAVVDLQGRLTDRGLRASSLAEDEPQFEAEL